MMLRSKVEWVESAELNMARSFAWFRSRGFHLSQNRPVAWHAPARGRQIDPGLALGIRERAWPSITVEADCGNSDNEPKGIPVGSGTYCWSGDAGRVAGRCPPELHGAIGHRPERQKPGKLDPHCIAAARSVLCAVVRDRHHRLRGAWHAGRVAG